MAAACISAMHCSVNARVAGHDLCFRQETQDLVFARAEENGIHEVTGSIPVSSTNSRNNLVGRRIR